MSVQLTPSKRPLEGIQAESNGRGKLPKSAASSQQTNSSVSVIRVLCSSSKIGSVIGKGGSIISQLRQETGVRIRVDDNLPGSDERIIFITSPDKGNQEKEKENKEKGNDATEQEKENNHTNDDVNGADNEEDGKGAGEIEGIVKQDQDGAVEGTPLDPEKETKTEVGMDVKLETEDVKLEMEDVKLEMEDVKLETEDVKLSGVQKALLLVFEKMKEGELEKGGGEDEEGNAVSSFSIRLLVFSSQIGCLLGKAGSVIKQMSSETGAQIRVLSRDKFPPSVSTSDELVQISGVPDAVKKALVSISQKLLENPSRDQRPLSSGQSSQSVGRSHQLFHGQGLPYSAGFRDGDAPRLNPFPDLLTFRLWCPHDKIGGVIGKGGAVVRGIQNETGCEIKVQDREADSEDRVIIIAGPAHPDERISAPQDAVLRVQSRIFRASPDVVEKTMLAKLLVSSNQIGCLLGKGGSIIAEMRKSTGAYIRILGKDQVPKGASGDEEVVQINGEIERVQDAIVQITTRLRDHFFRDSFPALNYPPNPAFLDQGPPFPPYMGRREHSPPGRYPNPGQPFFKFDSAGGLPPHGGFHPFDERPPFMQNFQRPGMPPHLPERMPNPAAWGPQGPIDSGGPLGLHDYPGGPPRRIGGFGLGGGNAPAVITSTTIEVVVPRTVVPSIYGEDGGCLRLIREISDARVNITDPKHGASETTIIISGTPEQTNAAQSLIQAFVISETESS